MIKEQAYEWMDKQIQALEMQLETIDGVMVSGIIAGEIHVYKGIEKLARTIGMPMNLRARDSVEYPIEYWFMYRGYRFFQLAKEVL